VTLRDQVKRDVLRLAQAGIPYWEIPFLLMDIYGGAASPIKVRTLLCELGLTGGRRGSRGKPITTVTREARRLKREGHSFSEIAFIVAPKLGYWPDPNSMRYIVGYGGGRP